MVVQHNLTAMNANRYLGINNSKLSKSLEKLSSGYAINRAGDNAAGLAVSEKMRSQIAGMTQGVKNAQDGISMVQTFEGALTETHSILQRMKTLADQMANGSYDDPVDRTAAQQEFLQLNDELDQIADTDFNGVIVLNGGKMADGLEQVDGLFDYANKAEQTAAANAKALADAQAAAQKNIDAAQKAFDAAKAQYDATSGRDLCLEGNAVQWNTVDDNAYTKAVAKDLFDNAKDGADSLTDLGVDSFEVQFKYDETNGWTVDKAWYVNDDGEEVDVDLSGTNLKDASITTTTNGGFQISSTGTAGEDTALGNAIFKASGAAAGDVVTLTYTNTASSSFAPTNIGMDEESLVDGMGLTEAPTLALAANITDANMTEETMAALDKLNNASVDFLYSSSGITGTISDDSLILSQDDPTTGVFNISYMNSDGKEIKLATITMDDPAAKSGATLKSATGNIAAGAAVTAGSTTFTFDGTSWDDGNGNATVTLQAGGTAIDPADLISGTAVKGDKITLTYGNVAAGATGTYDIELNASEGTVGKVSFGIALDEGQFSVIDTKPTIDPSKSPDGIDATAIDKAYADTKAALEAAKAAYPKTVEDLGDEYKVSKSDAFDNSEAKMTYKDSITLQVGARTKDAVNFTFQYNSDSIGDLAADLNCTASGLGTDKLNINSQSDANYAIDKIDQAINKVSLIRGTFGAIQNRLEHKIDNMNVSIENLTSAESQIRDTDMPTEMMNFTKQQILAQASQSMLAQANQLPQGVLSLLQ